MRNGNYELHPGDPRFPEQLAAIPDPPVILHVAGALSKAPAVAIVGSRECTSYGRSVATALAVELAGAGATVVSGLARGIDAAAHRGALAGGGHTVAVLPGGLQPVYPRSHGALARQILANGGALVAEHEPGTPVSRWLFPKRNRIIAGLSLVTVVVEAAVRSGARITADLALDYGREVLVVPGPITSPTSAGCNALLAQGAYPCTGAADIAAHLPPTSRDRLQANRVHTRPDDLSMIEQELLDLIHRHSGATLELVLRHCRLGVAQALATISALEIRGLIQRAPGNILSPRAMLDFKQPDPPSPSGAV